MQQNSCTNDAIYTDDNNIPYLTTERQYNSPPPVVPVLLSRTEASSRCPALGNIFKNALRYCAENALQSEVTSFIASAADLDALLVPEQHGKDVLVFFLPREFEPFLAATVSQEPCIFNGTTTDLMHCTTYSAWDFVGRPLASGVWVSEVALNALISNCYKPCGDLGYDPNGQIAPVIMVAGDTVAVGGFWVTQEFIAEAQCAGIGSSENWRPYRIYDKTKIEEAAQEAVRIGNQPWLHRFYEVNTGYWAIETTVLDYRHRN